MATRQVRRRRQTLLLTGARSIFDLTGERSYRAMRVQMPRKTRRTPKQLMVAGARTIQKVPIPTLPTR